MQDAIARQELPWQALSKLSTTPLPSPYSMTPRLRTMNNIVVPLTITYGLARKVQWFQSESLFYSYVLELFRSIVGPWVEICNILEVGFEFSMNNCIFSQMERSGGQFCCPKMSNNQKMDFTLGGYMFGRQIVENRAHQLFSSNRIIRKVGYMISRCCHQIFCRIFHPETKPLL